MRLLADIMSMRSFFWGSSARPVLFATTLRIGADSDDIGTKVRSESKYRSDCDALIRLVTTSAGQSHGSLKSIKIRREIELLESV